MEHLQTEPVVDKSRIDWLKGLIRDVPDFPKPGILFKDITPLLSNGDAFQFLVNSIASHCAKLNPDKIAGIEARGLIIGAAVAHGLGKGFIPVRKPGKLPYKSIKLTYDLEYGSDSLEIHVDATENHRVVLIDDVLATGGTAGAAARLIEKAGGRLLSIVFAIELEFLKGRSKLPPSVDVFSFISYQ